MMSKKFKPLGFHSIHLPSTLETNLLPQDSLAAVRKVRREVVDCMRLLMKLAKDRVADGMFLIVEDMLKKTKLLCNISDTILVEEALTFLEENKVTIRPEKDEFSESVAEFMQRNRLKIDLQFSRSVIGSKMMTPCTEFLSAELATPECDPCGGEAWRGYSVFTSGYQSVDRLSDIDEFEESFKVMSVEDKTRHYYTLFRDLSPGASTPNSPTVSPQSSVPASPDRDIPVKSPNPSKHSQDANLGQEAVRPLEMSTDLRSQAPTTDSDPSSQTRRSSQQDRQTPLSPSTTSPGLSAATSPIVSAPTSPEHVSISIDSKMDEAAESMPEDSLLEDDELSEEGLEVEEDNQTPEEEDEDEMSTPHIESETSKTQSPSSDKDAPSHLEEEKIRIIIEEEKMEDNEEEEEDKGDELEVKSGATTNSVNAASNLPPGDSPRRDQVFFCQPIMVVPMITLMLMITCMLTMLILIADADIDC